MLSRCSNILRAISTDRWAGTPADGCCAACSASMGLVDELYIMSCGEVLLMRTLGVVGKRGSVLVVCGEYLHAKYSNWLLKSS